MAAHSTHGSYESAMKLRVAKMTKDASLSDMMAIGTRVLHSERGCGKVIAVDADDPRHKPYIIEFDNGQVERLPPPPPHVSSWITS